MHVSNTSKLYLEWVRQGAAKIGKGAGKGLARALGISESAVSRMLAGKRRIQLAELPKIAEFIGDEVPSEAGVATTSSNKAPAQTALGNTQAVPLVRVSAVIAPSVWREAGVTVAIAERVPASPDPRIANLKQYACKIEAEPNRFAICVPYTDMRARPVVNDVVHVRRTRKGFYEDTLRTVRISAKGLVQLELEGARKEGEAVLLYPAPAKGPETIEIKGLVVGYFHPASF